MDIEQLTKSQIVLLTLLVSFVTSIATGIVTVSLMDQAPPAIAQTVNRVIERTVETVAPSQPAAAGQTAATVVTQEKTVIVKEADLISQAVERISPSVVRIYTGGENPTFKALGIVLDAQGAVVTDSSAIEGSDFSVSLADGSKVRMFVKARDAASGFAFLQLASSSESAVPWKPAPIAADRVVLGNSVVAVAGRSVARIVPGVVTAMLDGAVIDTNVSTDSIAPGSPIINTDGNVVGVSTSVSRASSQSGFVASTLLLPPADPKKK